MNVVENDEMNVIREFQIYFVICMIVGCIYREAKIDNDS